MKSIITILNYFPQYINTCSLHLYVFTYIYKFVNFINLVKKMKKWDDSELMNKVMVVKDSPHLVHEMIQNLVIIQGQSWMNTFMPYVHQFASIHVGQPYLAIPITPLCYGPKFPFINETEVM